MPTRMSPRSCFPWSTHCAWENSRLSWKLILSRKLGLKKGPSRLAIVLLTHTWWQDVVGVMGERRASPWVGTHTACGHGNTSTGVLRGGRQIHTTGSKVGTGDCQHRGTARPRCVCPHERFSDASWLPRRPWFSRGAPNQCPPLKPCPSL